MISRPIKLFGDSETDSDSIGHINPLFHFRLGS